ncbi:MAG: cation diffusion facilitator family transporter [Bilophila wadsworthia]
MTFFAVRVAARPADETHPYGYGKIENLSALAETVLRRHLRLDRARSRQPALLRRPRNHPSWWGVIIILISLLVDVNRAAMLRRVAQKHKSQALEADALHFTTDIWSSGRARRPALRAGQRIPSGGQPLPEHLHMADAIAALFVSGIVVVVGFRLSRRAVTMLLDGGGKEHSEALEQALAKQLPLCRVRRLRVRESGADVFMDITVEAPATLRLDAAHDVSCVIEDIAHEIVPSADITVHVEPAQEETESMLQLVRTVAAAHKLSVHNLILSEQSGGLLVFLHVEASPDMTLREAHEYVVMFEKALGKRLNTTRIETHIEPEDRLCTPENALPFDADLHYVRAAVDSILPEFPMVSNVHDLRLTHMGGTPLVSFHCIIDGDLSLAAAHDVATDMERRLRTCAPKLDRILIHTDPSALIVMPEER